MQDKCAYGPKSNSKTDKHEQRIRQEGVQNPKLAQENTAAGRTARRAGQAGQMVKRTRREQGSQLRKKAGTDKSEDADSAVDQSEIEIALFSIFKFYEHDFCELAHIKKRHIPK